MRYLIGALFGAVLVLVFFGVTTYYHYHQSQRLEDSSQKRSNSQQSSSADSRTAGTKTVDPRTKPKAYSSNSSRSKNQRQPASSSPVSSEQEPNLYTWKDKNGNKVISSRPPATGSYEKLTLPEEGLSVVEMEKAKPIRRKKDKRTRRYAVNSNSPSMIKQQLISKNKSKCRWLVGRAYGLYIKIKQHNGANKSIFCDEHEDRVIEMRQLRSEGLNCYYPYSSPSQC